MYTNSNRREQVNLNDQKGNKKRKIGIWPSSLNAGRFIGTGSGLVTMFRLNAASSRDRQKHLISCS